MGREYLLAYYKLRDGFVSNGNKEHLGLLPLLGQQAQAEFNGQGLRLKSKTFHLEHNISSCNICQTALSVIKVALQKEEEARLYYLTIEQS